MSKQTRFSTTTTTKRLLMRCIATLCVATAFLVRAEDVDAPIPTQLAKLVADDGAKLMLSVVPLQSAMVSCDGIAVVGARSKDSRSGAVCLFQMSSSDDASSWTQVAKLTAADGAANNYFGMSVAISDGTIVVGAVSEGHMSGSGSVYLFQMSSSGDASSWTQVAKLTADDGADMHFFGRSVAISDGIIVVGAVRRR